jgi:hypothetical protein
MFQFAILMSESFLLSCDVILISFQICFDERNADKCFLLIRRVIFRKDFHQCPLFERYPPLEECPRSCCKANGSEEISCHHLRPDGPVEKAEVGRMSEIIITGDTKREVLGKTFEFHLKRMRLSIRRLTFLMLPRRDFFS